MNLVKARAHVEGRQVRFPGNRLQQRLSLVRAIVVQNSVLIDRDEVNAKAFVRPRPVWGSFGRQNDVTGKLTGREMHNMSRLNELLHLRFHNFQLNGGIVPTCISENSLNVSQVY